MFSHTFSDSLYMWPYINVLSLTFRVKKSMCISVSVVWGYLLQIAQRFECLKHTNRTAFTAGITRRARAITNKVLLEEPKTRERWLQVYLKVISLWFCPVRSADTLFVIAEPTQWKTSEAMRQHCEAKSITLQAMLAPSLPRIPRKRRAKWCGSRT